MFVLTSSAVEYGYCAIEENSTYNDYYLDIRNNNIIDINSDADEQIDRIGLFNCFIHNVYNNIILIILQVVINLNMNDEGVFEDGTFKINNYKQLKNLVDMFKLILKPIIKKRVIINQSE